jgi:apolipoprotein N-acyltransferase
VSNRAKVIVGAILVGVGMLLALLPKDWIEETFGFEPDAGNGMLELALILVPIVLGVALIAVALVGSAAESRHRMAGGTDGNEESR